MSDSGYGHRNISCMIEIIPCMHCKLYGMGVVIMCHCMCILGGE